MDVKRRRFALYITFLWRIFVCPTNSTGMNTYLQCSKPSFILHKKLTHYRENSMFTEFLKLLRIGRTYTTVNILILECIKPQMGWYWFDMMAFICADVPLNICVCHRLSLLILCQVIYVINVSCWYIQHQYLRNMRRSTELYFTYNSVIYFCLRLQTYSI